MKMKLFSSTKNMTVGKPLSLLFSFAVPILLSSLLQQVYNATDTIIVGQFVGKNALAAVGSTGNITGLLFTLHSGLAGGSAILVTQYFGAGNDKMMRRSIVSCIYLMTITGILSGIIGFAAAPYVLRLMNTPETILAEAILYMQINCIGMIFVSSYNLANSVLRATGDSRTPLLFLVVSCLINIILDLVFVIAFSWGVAGTAIATVIAQSFSAVACIIYALKTKPYFKFLRDDWKPDRAIIKGCVLLGLPLALQSSLIYFSNITLQRVVNGFGETMVATYTVTNRYESMIIHQPLSAVGTAVSTYTGQNIGAGKIERVKKGFSAGMLLNTAFVVLIIPVALLFGDKMITLFTGERDVIDIGATVVKIMTPFYIPLGCIYVTRPLLNGAGDTRFALLTGLIEVLVRICIAGPLTAIPFIGCWGIWLTTGVTWTAVAILGLIQYYRTIVRRPQSKIGINRYTQPSSKEESAPDRQ